MMPGQYVLAIPPLPWSVDKHILRTAMKDVLPEAILARPKTPLAGDPAVERLRESPQAWLDNFEPGEETQRYVARGAIPHVAGETNSELLLQNLRPLALDAWIATSLAAPEFRFRIASDCQQPLAFAYADDGSTGAAW